MQGDTSAELYINGAFARVDETLPALPMNGIQQQLAAGHSTKVYKLTGALQPGDVVAVKVRSTRPTMVPVTDALGVTTNYSGYSALAAAFSDGTMTDEAWKCTQDHEEPEEPAEDYTPWFSPFFRDDSWPNAVVQDISCCPWRDEPKAWKALNVQWIAAPWYANYTNSRLFYCRYYVPGDGGNHPQKLSVEQGSRLPFRETENSTLFFTEAMGCQSSYSLLEEGCFRHYVGRPGFAEANASCSESALGGALASIDSEAQDLAAFAFAGRGRTLIGITDAAVEGEWRTAYDGSLISYENWNVTALEPADGVSENCAAMLYQSGQWGDVPCELAFPPYEGYLCRSEACRDFSGNWQLDQWGYLTENLTQLACVGEWIGEELYDVLADRITLRSGRTGHLQRFAGYDELHWEDGVVWTRFLGSPKVTIVGLALSASDVQVSFNVSRRSQVSCNIVDARYLLRTPTSLELERTGTTVVVNPTAPGFEVVGNETTGLDYEVTVLETHDVVIREECEDLCMQAYPSCVLMTFFLTGSDLATGRNCRLAEAFNESATRGISASAIFQHKSLAERVVTHDMQIAGMIVAGQIYHAFCKTRDVYTGVHSTLLMISDTKYTERADGAVDGGSLNKPRVQLLGGFASSDALVPVAKASRPGRIFCAAFASADRPAGNWTASQIKAPGMFSILVIANQSVPVEIAGLLPSTSYEVACVADGDGGAESPPEDIQATRRLWTTEAQEPTIATMSAEIVPSRIQDGAIDVNTYVDITELGYLWCLVLDSNATRTRGVPRARDIVADGLVQKVQDLRQAAAGSFENYPANKTWEVYCTAEFNDFSNETDSDSMGSPFPIARILQHEVYPNRVKLWVKVDRGPAAVHCQAFMWSDKPTTRRPTTPIIPTEGGWLAAPRVGNGKDLQALLFGSPWRFVILAPGGGVAIFDIAPLGTGSWHDVYCYAEELMEEVPAGAEPPPRMGMTSEAIRKTLLVIKTRGPAYQEGGWHCVAGRPCNITGVTGDGLTGRDRVLVRSDPCPGICQCNGDEDTLRKGGACSPVSQDPAVVMPLPGVLPDRLDPKGEWCYVDAGACSDGVKSEQFPALTLSYKACAYNSVAGPASGPEGFPLQGLATPLTPDRTLVTRMRWLDLDCERLLSWQAYRAAFELNVRQAFLVALGTKYQGQDVTFEFTISTNPGECFVDALVAVPTDVNEYVSQAALRRAMMDWLPGDIHRRVTGVNLIKNTFLGFDNTVTLKNLTDPVIELDPVPGTAFGWGSESFAAPGFGYHLCYCNGTESNCVTERDYTLALGRLHMSGPSAAQIAATETCIGGLPCEIRQLDHHAAANGSRLVVLPASADGCRWRRRSLGDPPGVQNFLNGGVSDVATSFGSHYLWGAGAPLVVEPGVYLLCWCGPAILRTRPDTELDVLYAEGGFEAPCPAERPEDGAGFLAPSGQLRVVGPAAIGTVTCSIGLQCALGGVVGEQLRGGDTVAILRECGQEPPDSDRFEWTTQGPGSALTTTMTTTAWSGPGQPGGLDQWMEGGWIEYGPVLTELQLESIGIGGQTGRGMWGFPNRGISEPTARVGYFQWPGPLWAFAGDYQICWCATGSGENDLASVVQRWRQGEGEWCTAPEHFLVPVGILRVTGPAVLPRASQVFQCVRRRSCEIRGFEGTMPEGSKLLIAEAECGGGPKPGAPNEGVSLSSTDGHVYSWGNAGMFLEPGLYRLCWCAAVITCFEARDYAAYSGLLRIKAPLSPPVPRFCPLGKECNITGIYGSGLHNGDRIAVLAACGAGEFSSKFTKQGVSTRTFGLGSGFTLPPSITYGTFRVCWCAGENICSKGTDFDTDLGGLTVGGPDPSAIYVCFEWQPCSIKVQGALLRDRDMLRLVPAGTDCAATAASAAGPGLVPGFPRHGVALPAGGGGFQYSFGDELIRSEPGIYDLCYCSFEHSPTYCQNQSDFYTPGGSIRVGNSKEYQYLTREEDPVPRSSDHVYAILLAILLPGLFLLAGFVGWGRHRLFKKLAGDRGGGGEKGELAIVEAEAPSLFPERVSFAALAQRKMKEMFEVKQVLELRLAAPGSEERGGFGPVSKKKSPKSLASIADIPDFRSQLARKKARLRELGEDTDVEYETENTHGSGQEQAELPGTLPGTQNFTGALSRSGRRPSNVSCFSDDSQALRELGDRRSAASMDSTEATRTARTLATTLQSRLSASTDESEDRPKPPSMEFSNYMRSARIMDMLEM